MDFDGVLTDGGIYINNEGNHIRRFDVKDGLGIKLLQRYSINIAIVSGSNSEVIEKRGKALDIKIIKKAVKNKYEEVKLIQQETGSIPNQTLFLGDDVNDLPVIPLVKFFIVPFDAHIACKKKADFIANSCGGKGFIREITDQILTAKGINPFKSFKGINDNEILRF
tara:strand:+ start:2178 stop:2678 length:501 start_codon:yes stop_codon:yes gene_type:complete